MVLHHFGMIKTQAKVAQSPLCMHRTNTKDPAGTLKLHTTTLTNTITALPVDVIKFGRFTK